MCGGLGIHKLTSYLSLSPKQYKELSGQNKEPPLLAFDALSETVIRDTEILNAGVNSEWSLAYAMALMELEERSQTRKMCQLMCEDKLKAMGGAGLAGLTLKQMMKLRAKLEKGRTSFPKAGGDLLTGNIVTPELAKHVKFFEKQRQGLGLRDKGSEYSNSTSLYKTATSLAKKGKLAVLDISFLVSDCNFDPPTHLLDEESNSLKCKIVTARPPQSELDRKQKQKQKDKEKPAPKKLGRLKKYSNDKDKEEGDIDDLQSLLGNISVSIKPSSFRDEIQEGYRDIAIIEEYAEAARLLQALKANEGERAKRKEAEAALLKEEEEKALRKKEEEAQRKREINEKKKATLERNRVNRWKEKEVEGK